MARDGSFPATESRRLLVDGRNDPSPSFRYFKYRQMVRCLIDAEHLSFAGVVERAGDPVTVEADTRSALRRGELP